MGENDADPSQMLLASASFRDQHHALLLIRSDPSKLGRVRRLISELQASGYSLDIAGPPTTGDIVPYRHFPIQRHERRRPWTRGIRGVFRELLGCAAWCLRRRMVGLQLFETSIGAGSSWSQQITGRYSVVVCEDLALLGHATRIADQTGARLVVEIRDFLAERDLQRIGLWRVFKNGWSLELEMRRRYLDGVDCVVVVSEGQAEDLRSEHAVSVVVVRSMPDLTRIDPSPVTSFPLKLVYHGIAHPDRGIDALIQAASLLPEKVSLYLYLTGDEKSYMRQLTRVCGDLSNVRIVAHVSLGQLITETRQYDIGVIALKPLYSNSRFALPNKFFEYIQARLAVLVSEETPEMASLVRTYGLGFTVEHADVSDLVSVLDSLTVEEVQAAKKSSSRWASEFCFEQERSFLRMALGLPLVSSN